MEIWIKQLLFDLLPLGWSIFNSIWQSLIFLCFYKIILLINPKIQAENKYWMSLGFLVLVFGLFISGIFKEYSTTTTNPLSLDNSYPFNYSKVIFYASIPKTISIITIKTFCDTPFLPLVFGVFGMTYILILALMISRLVKNVFFLKELQTNDKLILPKKDILILFKNVKIKMGIHLKIKIWMSEQINSPITFGFLKPIILFPLAICTKLSLSQIEGIIVHELAHIKRDDFLINIFQNFTETILFFNPVIWYLNKEIRIEREKCCDDWVDKYYSGDTILYAQTLLALEENRHLKSNLVLAAIGTKNPLLDRIKRIITGTSGSKISFTFQGGIIILLVSLGTFSFLGLRNIPEKKTYKNSISEKENKLNIQKISFIPRLDSPIFNSTFIKEINKKTIRLINKPYINFEEEVNAQLKDTLKLPLSLELKLKDSLELATNLKKLELSNSNLKDFKLKDFKFRRPRFYSNQKKNWQKLPNFQNDVEHSYFKKLPNFKYKIGSEQLSDSIKKSNFRSIRFLDPQI